MATRIRNISQDRLEIPLLGIVLEPGDVTNVPEEYKDVAFSESYFEVEGQQPQDQDQGNEPIVVHKTDQDAGNAQEGNQ